MMRNKVEKNMENNAYPWNGKVSNMPTNETWVNQKIRVYFLSEVPFSTKQ